MIDANVILRLRWITFKINSEFALNSLVGLADNGDLAIELALLDALDHESGAWARAYRRIWLRHLSPLHPQSEDRRTCISAVKLRTGRNSRRENATTPPLIGNYFIDTATPSRAADKRTTTPSRTSPVHGHVKIVWSVCLLLKL